MSAAPKLSELASGMRSKNAEPYLTTIDVFFADRDAYDTVRDSGSLSAATVAATYGIPEAAVFGIYFVDALEVAKVSLYKYDDDEFLGAGDPALSDMIGAQAYVPLLDLEIVVADR
jgi:hypothetical protein